MNITGTQTIIEGLAESPMWFSSVAKMAAVVEGVADDVPGSVRRQR